MELLNIHRQNDKQTLAAGKLLIAEPFLSEPSFARTVIFLCDYKESEGSIGFVLNRPTQLTLGDLLPEYANTALDIYQGGPVQVDTLHMLHRKPAIFGGNEVLPGVYWGGSYDALQSSIANNDYNEKDLRLFVGYSGWDPGQLEKEISDGTWLIADINEKLLFDTDAQDVWNEAVTMLGGEYAMMVNMPLDPQLN